MVDHVLRLNSRKLFLRNIVLIVSLLSKDNKSPLDWISSTSFHSHDSVVLEQLGQRDTKPCKHSIFTKLQSALPTSITVHIPSIHSAPPPYVHNQPNSMGMINIPQKKPLKKGRTISWHFQLNLATAPQTQLFLSLVIKLLIKATLSLPHPASQEPFFSRIKLHLIFCKHCVFI